MKRSVTDADARPAPTPPTAGEPSRDRPRGPGRRLVGSIRTVAVLALFCTLLQAAFAGLFVTGDVGMLDLHGMNAGLVILMTLAQTVNAVLLWRGNRSLKWPMAAGLVMIVMVGAQQMMGDQRIIAWHILLGTALVGVKTAMLCWAFTLRPVPAAPVAEVAR
ncbi:hypothetical protein [Streptomyces sp. NPDC087512]|uniref:hypothetical protein n=1 Tax=unclassified Streptomyces TaxID=2593676 RepID=UPI00342D2E08